MQAPIPSRSRRNNAVWIAPNAYTAATTSAIMIALEFRVDRTPNRQIGFGFGAHMCLGVHLARMEMAIFFEELLPRLESLELAGTPRRTVTNFVGGPKSLPIRFRMRE